MPPRLLVLSALGFEAAPLARWLRGRFWPVAVAVTGMGPESAREGAARAIRRQRPQVVLGIGLCGALDPGARFGAIAFPAEVVGEAAGAPPLPLGTSGLHPPGGRLLSVGRAACDPARKAMLSARHQAQWVDMESYAWAEACAAAGVPLLVVRVVLDEADRWLPTWRVPRSWPQMAGLPLRALAARSILFQAGRRVVCALLSPEAPDLSGFTWRASCAPPATGCGS